jgi:RNA polymerase sigma-70 factor, ECF subfamily
MAKRAPLFYYSSQPAEGRRRPGRSDRDMGDREALFTEVEEATPALRRYARALCVLAGSIAADDLVQSAIDKAAAAIRERRLQGGEPGAARLCAYHALTSAAREELAGLEGAKLSARHPAIAQGLASLPFEERAAILLVALEGFSYAAAAEIAGTRCETLVARLMRARAALSTLDLRPPAPSDGQRRAGGHLRLVK